MKKKKLTYEELEEKIEELEEEISQLEEETEDSASELVEVSSDNDRLREVLQEIKDMIEDTL